MFEIPVFDICHGVSSDTSMFSHCHADSEGRD